MWKNEFRRHFFSIKTLLSLIILVIIGIMNIMYQYNNHLEYMNTYNHHYEDVNDERMLELLSSYNGIEVGIQFLVKSEFIEIYIIALCLFVRNIYII